MWLAVEATPPEVPYETIGLVIVALITGITGVVVAVVQRGKRQAASPAPTAGEAITRTDPEWQKYRDTVILDRATVVMLEREVRGVSDELDDHIQKAAARQGRADEGAKNTKESLHELREEFNRFRDSFR